MTRTEKKILKALGEGCYLDGGVFRGGEQIGVRPAYSKPAVFWTTRKTVRKMVQQGLLTRSWELPERHATAGEVQADGEGSGPE